MGLFDKSFLGGMFDLNGDGKIDISEEFMAYKMFEEVTRDDDDDEDSEDDLFDDDDDDSKDDLFDDEDDWN